MDGKATGLPVDYHYYGTGDIGGSPSEASVKLLEAIVTKSRAPLPTPVDRTDLDVEPGDFSRTAPPVQLGDGPVRVISSKADQMFLDILRVRQGRRAAALSRATWSSPTTPPAR